MAKNKENSVPLKDKSNQVLNKMKNKFETVLVIGVYPDGNIDMDATIVQYPYLHWMLNKAIFQLNLHENQTLAKNSSTKEEEKAA